MDPSSLAALGDILKLVGGTSPLIALLVWYIWTQRAELTKLGDKVDKLTDSWNAVNVRLSVIENFVEYNTSTVTRKLNT